MKQSMRKKIQSSMILVIALTLIIAYAITTLVVYRQTIHIMEGEVRQEADYINVAIDTSGESYLKIMDKVHKDTRITLIDSDGNVKYRIGIQYNKADQTKAPPARAVPDSVS